MYTPPKLKYGPTQMYKSDINDLVEEEIMKKGGLGSGTKGHRTIKDKHGGSHGAGGKMPKVMRDHFEEAYNNMSDKEREYYFGKKKRNPDISLEAKKEKVANDKWRKERLPNRK